MIIDVVCPNCNRQIQTKAEYVGKRAKCKCGRVFVIEQPVATPPVAALPVSEDEEDAPLPILVQDENQSDNQPEGFWTTVKKAAVEVSEAASATMGDSGKRDAGSFPNERRAVTPPKFDWRNWNLGGKVIFVSTCAAAASMLIPWVDIGIASRNGISQGAILFLALFIYPMWGLLTNRSINLWGGIACGAGGILFSLLYIASKEVEIYGISGNAASGGSYVFLLSCVALIFGVVKYPIALKPTITSQHTAQAEQLAKLEAARESGILTKDEFQKKKAEILSRP